LNPLAIQVSKADVKPQRETLEAGTDQARVRGPDTGVHGQLSAELVALGLVILRIMYNT
jgi:hypothetical protein